MAALKERFAGFANPKEGNRRRLGDRCSGVGQSVPEYGNLLANAWKFLLFFSGNPVPNRLFRQQSEPLGGPDQQRRDYPMMKKLAVATLFVGSLFAVPALAADTSQCTALIKDFDRACPVT